MKTYKLFLDKGDFFAFEIENAYIRPNRIAKLLCSIDGVSDVKIESRKLFGASEDIRVQFKYHGNECMVWEPFGDNSRYWIGPKQEGDVIDIAAVEKEFAKYQPPVMAKLFGDIVTLNFKSLFHLKS